MTLFGWEGNRRPGGSPPAGEWLKVTCGLTACTLGSALGPTLGNEYGRIFAVFTVRRYASAVYAVVFVFVSVRHAPVLYQNGYSFLLY